MDKQATKAGADRSTQEIPEVLRGMPDAAWQASWGVVYRQHCTEVCALWRGVVTLDRHKMAQDSRRRRKHLRANAVREQVQRTAG